MQYSEAEDAAIVVTGCARIVSQSYIVLAISPTFKALNVIIVIPNDNN